jgi:excisionase family DNA binding protein
MEEKLLTLPEAAAVLRLGRSRLYQLFEEGKIPGRQINGRGRILFLKSELQAALLPKEIKKREGAND